MKFFHYVKVTKVLLINIEISIENIVAKCDNYIDPQLAICIIRDNCTMGSNNIGELKKYGIENEDSYVEKVLKVLKHENIFITFGMLAFIPMFNECDIFSIEDKTISLSSEEFQKYGDLKEEYFGILIKKNSNDFLYADVKSIHHLDKSKKAKTTSIKQ